MLFSKLSTGWAVPRLQSSHGGSPPVLQSTMPLSSLVNLLYKVIMNILTWPKPSLFVIFSCSFTCSMTTINPSWMTSFFVAYIIYSANLCYFQFSPFLNRHEDILKFTENFLTFWQGSSFHTLVWIFLSFCKQLRDPVPKKHIWNYSHISSHWSPYHYSFQIEASERSAENHNLQ